MTLPHDHEEQLAAAAADGDAAALAALFADYRDKLWRMAHFRLDPRLATRVDEEDVLQDAWLAAVQRRAQLGERAGSMTVFAWLRSFVEQAVIDLHRRHLGAQMRSVQQEVRIGAPRRWGSDSVSSMLLPDDVTSPSEAAMRVETRQQLLDVLERMSALDREVLVMRHFEELSNNDVAAALGMGKTAVSNRYVRALRRVSAVMRRPDERKSG